MNSRKLTIGLFLLYLLALTWIILFKLQFSVEGLNHLRNINLIPFAGSAIHNGKIAISEIINNILAFIPYGIFVCMLMERKNFIIKVIPIFLTSLAFELLQLVFAIGAADITDLIGNTAGGMIGIGIFFVFSKIFKEKVFKVINIISFIAAILLILFVGLLLVVSRLVYR